MKILSVDPGKTGYLCFFNDFIKTIYFLKTTTEPHILIEEIQKFNPNIVIIEDVHSVFGSSAKANFSFGFNVGLLYGILNAAKIPVIHKVQPKEWQRTLQVTTKGKAIKKEVAEICKQHYPDVILCGKRGGLQDGKSDSLGIAIHTFKQREKYENIFK